MKLQGVKAGLKAKDGALSVGATMEGFPSLAKIEQQLSTQLGNKATIRIFSKEGYQSIVKPAASTIVK